MTGGLTRWFIRRWRREPIGPDLAESYRATFTSAHGQRVLQHLLDEVYCTIYDGCDPNEALVHNARRSLVQEILENLDVGEHPEKYRGMLGMEAIRSTGLYEGAHRGEREPSVV